jgi:hypothetical protein
MHALSHGDINNKTLPTPVLFAASCTFVRSVPEFRTPIAAWFLRPWSPPSCSLVPLFPWSLGPCLS